MKNNQISSDEKLMFADESSSMIGVSDRHYKLLIADDENEIHVMTKLVLSDYEYKESGIEFLSAFSGKEAKAIIKEHPDIACILLDVVMETEDAGLEVARYVRETLKNTKTRIILRTGQPGKAPEKDIILEYDINDYKEKTELTSQKLFTTVTTALRSFLHLRELEEKTKEIESKNIRLNEEIARRIVAESNLTKYNRSLEKMIQIKSARLEKALISLETKEIELLQARKAVMVSDISSVSIHTLDKSGNAALSNLDTINTYRREMTLLLEKYNALQGIFISGQKSQDLVRAATHTLEEIDREKNRMDLESMLQDYPVIIEDSSKGLERIADAVSDMMLIIESGKEPFQSTDIKLAIEEAAEQVKACFDSKVDLKINLKETPPLFLPKQSFQKAVMAVVENGFQAMGEKGVVSITSHYEDQDLVIHISDMGCGISPEHLPHVFKPYFTAGFENTKGLGLSLARHILLSCNGDMQIASTFGEGTCVSLRLNMDRGKNTSTGRLG